MSLPDLSSERILAAITAKPLLDKEAADELLDTLNKQKEVNWNLVLTKQFESEKGGQDEAKS